MVCFWQQKWGGGVTLASDHTSRPHSPKTALQHTWVGLAVYGVLVASLEFLPLGGINPKDAAEYLNAVRATTVCVCVYVHLCVCMVCWWHRWGV